MDRFPAEFSDLLNKRGRRLLVNPPQFEELIARRETPIVYLDDVIDAGVGAECIRLLDDSVYPRLRRMHAPIDREALTAMKENYKDKLPKTVRVKTATLNSRKSQALDAAREIGLDAMMMSKSFRDLAQKFTRHHLVDKTWDRQVICYETGDYSGPHNDHHPENDESRNGFVDLHIMFSNSAVAQQLLVYERRGFLSVAQDVSQTPAISAYRLPFWHYTTPLQARPGAEERARRWLLLGTFHYDPPLPKLQYR